MMAKLAVCGGMPVRTREFPKWPVRDIREEEALIDVVRSGEWGIGSRAVAEFDKKFAEFLGAKYAISCTNGTDAISIGLQALGIRAGDEVILPPYTFMATSTATLAVNAVPIFVDIDPDTYNIDPDKIEEAITDRTRAIIPVHIAGNPVDMDRIMRVAKKYDLRVLEDSAQAHGARWAGKMAGTIGDVGAWSFQSSKNVTSGEGGATATNDEKIFDRLFSFQNCGRVRTGKWYEHHNMSGNHRLSAFQAAVLIVQLDRVEEYCVRREKNAAYLDSRLREIGGVEPTVMTPGATRHAYHLYIFRFNSEEFGGVSRNVFLKALQAEGVPCSEGYVPLYKLPLFQHLDESWPALNKVSARYMDYSKVSCPVCERVCREEAVWLTQNMLIGDQSDMDDIAEAVAKIKGNLGELRGVAE